MVDYIIVTQENLENVLDFEVRTVNDIVNTFSLHELAGGGILDYSLVCCTLKLSYNVPADHPYVGDETPSRARISEQVTFSHRQG